MPSLLCIPVLPVPTVSELNFLFDFLFEGFNVGFKVLIQKAKSWSEVPQ